MRWRQGVISAVLLTTGAGCPHDHMREGFLDRAARKDTRDAMKEECEPGEELTRVCKKNEKGVLECEEKCQ